MKLFRRKGYEETTLRIVTDDEKTAYAMLATLEDFVKVGIIEQVNENDENWKKWLVMYMDDLAQDNDECLVFDTREEALREVKR